MARRRKGKTAPCRDEEAFCRASVELKGPSPQLLASPPKEELSAARPPLPPVSPQCFGHGPHKTLQVKRHVLSDFPLRLSLEEKPLACGRGKH